MQNWTNKLRSKFKFQLMYLQNPPWDTGITPPEVIDYIHTHTPGRVLDLGCGTGTNVLTLVKHGWEATGIDFTPKAIRQARRKAKQAGLAAKFLVGDVSNGKLYDGPYDLILDIGCYHALDSAQRPDYQENIFKHLAPNGDYLLYAFSKRLPDEDVEAFQKGLTLTKRVDSDDPSGPASAWLWFEAPEHK